VFGCACYPNLAAKTAHKLAPRSTRYIFLRYSANHKGYRCLDLTTTNIVVSRHVVFNEVDFSFSASPRLTNDLDILLHDDSPGVAHMPTLLPAPRIPPGFPPLTAAGGHTARGTEVGSQTARRTGAGGPTASPGGQIAHGTGTGGPTVSPGGQIAHGTGAGGPTMSPGSPTAHGTGAGSPTADPAQLLCRLLCQPRPSLVRRPRLQLCPTRRPRLQPRHARPRRPQLRPHHLQLRHPSYTRCTTRVALGLHGSHRHRLYISSHHQQRLYRWLLRSTLI
jgi:hypothetical protein